MSLPTLALTLCPSPACLSRVALIGLLALAGLAGEGVAEPGPRVSPGTGRAVSTKPVKRLGKASWYGPGFHGKKTASGERFN